MPIVTMKPIRMSGFTLFAAQLQAAHKEMVERHKRMTEAGFKWDGVDGYEAPAHLSKDEIDAIINGN